MVKDSDLPEFVFVCGAVGSGNTLMFQCLIHDKNVYGINEDALGSTLERLLSSQKDMNACPHSVAAFTRFLHDLRGDRRTLILKTPSNIRRHEILIKHLPKSHFILMVREPHAAIVSGITRHGNDKRIADIGEIWRRDTEIVLKLSTSGRSSCATYEKLASNPSQVLDQIADQVMPLSPDVYQYAERMAAPERAQANRWKSKVHGSIQQEIEETVKSLSLTELYRQVCELSVAPTESNTNRPLRRTTNLSGRVAQARRIFYRLRYKFFR